MSRFGPILAHKGAKIFAWKEGKTMNIFSYNEVKFWSIIKTNYELYSKIKRKIKLYDEQGNIGGKSISRKNQTMNYTPNLIDFPQNYELLYTPR